jgi:trk system potassium uptake protein TrkA
MREKTNFIGAPTKVKEVIGVPTANTQIEKDDIMVVFGLNEKITDLNHIR